MKLAYKPLGLAVSVLGGLLANFVFGKIWQSISGEDEAPHATSEDYGWREVLLAAAIQGAVFGLVKTAIDRAGATGFQAVTGTWPED
ncbi:DUF4235 domain-containing protein [Nocardia sp. NPDC057353]|uniref:DUF4235 domain-containing protein n=1 Tax=Nocardia sp. NPDC057353 TaxID=3346104 RepID=UPI0036371ED0